MRVQKHQTARSAGSPVFTRSMPYLSATVPSQGHPRNMTGIYLGLEGNFKPPRPKSSIPPLARSRVLSKIRTPVEEQRFRRVEELRIKEEKRGFVGNPVKRHHHATVDEHSQPRARDLLSAKEKEAAVTALSCSVGRRDGSGVVSDMSGLRRWGPGKRIDPANLDDLIRPNSRHFTTVSNSGVTRSEKLTGWLGGLPRAESGDDPTPDLGVAREIDRISREDMAGLEECFRRVCKGNLGVLYSLLPGRKAQSVKRENTGFAIRGYRNPNQAEILAEFPSNLRPGTRPKTVPLQGPQIPQPYFFRHCPLHPGGASFAYQPFGHRREAVNYFYGTCKAQVSPGAGSISRSLHHRPQSLVAPSAYVTLPSTASQRKIYETADQSKAPCSRQSLSSEGEVGEDPPSKGQRPTADVHVTVVSEAHSSLQPSLKDMSGSASRSATPQMDNVDNTNEGSVDIPVTEVQEDLDGPSTTENQRPRPKLTASNSGADIMLGLETDEGQSAEVEIDTADQEELMPEAEVPKGRVRKASITEKVIKSKASEALAAMIKEEAELRQREFEKLLDEHAELVQEISRTPSSENLIQGERDH